MPWVELGGSVSISCAKTGYGATVEFLTKPFYGGKKNRITAEILQPDRKAFVTISGEWNGAMIAKWADGVSSIILLPFESDLDDLERFVLVTHGHRRPPK